jgi:hypothetical protein
MTKRTELQATVKKRGILNNTLFELIAFHNEGKGTYSLQDILSYCKGKRTEYPNTLENMIMAISENDFTIMEDGVAVNLIIKEIKK